MFLHKEQAKANSRLKRRRAAEGSSRHHREAASNKQSFFRVATSDSFAGSRLAVMRVLSYTEEHHSFECYGQATDWFAVP